jgi:site-specific recombinase XerD
LLDNIETRYPERDKLMIGLMLLLGLRVSEVANLNVPDINFYNDILYVHGKGNKERVVPISPQIKQDILNYLKYREEKFGDIPNNALFLSRNKRRISVRRIQMIFDQLVDSLGFNEGKEHEPSRKKITCHKLRHTFGTLSAQEGVDILTLKDLLGHTSINTTQIYAKAADKQMRDAVNSNPVYK